MSVPGTDMFSYGPKSIRSVLVGCADGPLGPL